MGHPDKNSILAVMKLFFQVQDQNTSHSETYMYRMKFVIYIIIHVHVGMSDKVYFRHAM